MAPQLYGLLHLGSSSQQYLPNVPQPLHTPELHHRLAALSQPFEEFTL